MRTFKEAEAYLGKKTDRPLATHTRLIRLEDGKIAVRYHKTNVVTYWPTGWVELRADGWLTSTTKSRICEYSPVSISQHRGVWTVYGPYRETDGRQTIGQFRDGCRVRIANDGRLSGLGFIKPSPAQSAKDKKLVAKLTQYSKDYVAALAAGKVKYGGDCLICQAEANGFPEKRDHLESHIKEKYYVAAMLNLLDRKMLSPLCQSWIHACVTGREAERNADWMKPISARQLQRALLRFLKRRFGVAQ